MLWSRNKCRLNCSADESAAEGTGAAAAAGTAVESPGRGVRTSWLGVLPPLRVESITSDSATASAAASVPAVVEVGAEAGVSTLKPYLVYWDPSSDLQQQKIIKTNSEICTVYDVSYKKEANWEKALIFTKECEI